jgi:CarboxypepD_reg-like domain
MTRIAFYRRLSLIMATLFILAGNRSIAQSDYRQTIKGYITDAESKKPLAGITVQLTTLKENAVTDSLGFYAFRNIPVGRYTIEYSGVGYESKILQDMVLVSGKQLTLDLPLIQNYKTLENVQVVASKNKSRPLNEFATLSARSFSSGDAKRYPASFSDPARMVMNFPGVSAADDGSNAIVVRGNSPQGVLWKLEGIEIPTPNHFSSLGSSGGAVSMLSSNVIGRSDFYTGAFPAEIGDATSAVFDINFREGNKDKPEYSVMLGTLGAEIAAEGPVGKQKNASYLFNYRYSTLAILQSVLNLQGIPEYQDLSFKLNWNTLKAGSFTLFGLGGYNTYSSKGIRDSTKWNDDGDDLNVNVLGKTYYGVMGISQQYFVRPDAYFKTVLAATYNQETNRVDTLNPAAGYDPNLSVKEKYTNSTWKLSSFYNNKLNSRQTIRTGLVVSQLHYDLSGIRYDNADESLKQMINGTGNTFYYQLFFQSKYRLTQELTLNAGVNGSWLALNQKSSIEPRLALTYQKNGETFSLAAGLHSRPQDISTYLFQDAVGAPTAYPNKDLDIPKAAHIVAGYEKFFSQLNLKTHIEAYYQYLYDVPVEKNMTSGFSAINMQDIYDLLDVTQLVSTGTGRNYGVDLNVERPFSNNFYFIANISVFKSTYTNFAGQTYNTRYDRNYSVNLIAGKEWKSRRNNRKSYGVSGKILTSGGLRNSVIDIPASVQAGKQVLVSNEYYTLQGPTYFRTDWSVFKKINRKRSTHTLSLEIQNLTNNQNFLMYYFDTRTGTQKTAYQLGILPNISYKIDFH